MRRWLVFAFIALLALLAAPRCAAEDSLEIPNFKTMKIKELKAILADRGKECKGCAEKADFVAMAADVWSLPVIEKPAETEKPATPDLSDVDDERIKRMMDEMQKTLARRRAKVGPLVIFTDMEYKVIDAKQEMHKKVIE